MSLRERLTRTGTFRQSVAYAAALALIVLALGAWVWGITGGRADAQLNQLISSESYTTYVGVRDGGRDKAVADIEMRFGQKPITDRVILLADEEFHPLAGNLSAWPAPVAGALGWHSLQIIREAGPSEARVLHSVLSDGSHLLYGYDLSDYFAGRKSFFGAFLGTALLLLTAGLLSGLYIRQLLLGQVAAIAATTRGIMAGDLKHRVPRRGTHAEFALLASTINEMLDHIERLVSGIADVSNAVAHDLRTPLAETRSRLEGLLRARADDPVAVTAVEAAIADVDKLIRTFNALLRLAQIETGARRAGFRRIELVGLVGEVVEFYQLAAEKKDQSLAFDAPAELTIHSDPPLLAQAIANLLDNATKYTPAGGQIAVRLRGTGNGDRITGAEITVADSGPGIAEAERAKAVTRFYRGDSSRATEGAGLGLSLVSAIAALHGGDLRLADNHPGLCAVLTVPVEPGAARAGA